MAIEGAKLKAGNMHSLGHESEPKQPHGPKVRGKHPALHSHSAFPKRKVLSKSGRKAPY